MIFLLKNYSMKSLWILFFFLSATCFSQQEPVFNFEKNKAYKIFLKGADDFKKADEIGRQMEKMQLAIFSYVDSVNGIGYFIVDNFYKVHEIEKMINNTDGYSYIGFEEIPLNGDNFLDMYMKRGGFENNEFSSNAPKKVMMGPFENLSKSLYKKAVSVWVQKYPENKEMVEKYYIEKIKNEVPKFVDTGNPEKDNQEYNKAKEKWINENPEKYDRIIKYKEDE
jgi:hypothetical protein